MLTGCVQLFCCASKCVYCLRTYCTYDGAHTITVYVALGLFRMLLCAVCSAWSRTFVTPLSNIVLELHHKQLRHYSTIWWHWWQNLLFSYFLHGPAWFRFTNIRKSAWCPFTNIRKVHGADYQYTQSGVTIWGCIAVLLCRDRVDLEAPTDG